MPLHAVTAYPLVAAFGYSLGMKLATLLAGIGVLIAAYFLLKRTMGERAAYWGVILISLHHGFAVMTQLGSADLLLTLFFLLTLHAYLSAERGLRWYLAMGLFLGLACLTRYNALPLFLFLPLYTFWKRRNHLRSPWFIGGMLLAAALASLWFLRNIAVFGTLENDYTGELSIKSAGIFRQFFINASYYLDPLKNILPRFAAVCGLRRMESAEGTNIPHHDDDRHLVALCRMASPECSLCVSGVHRASRVRRLWDF